MSGAEFVASGRSPRGNGHRHIGRGSGANAARFSSHAHHPTQTIIDMLLEIVFTLLALAVLTLIVFAGMHGAFTRVSVREEQDGPFEFVYRTAPAGDFKAVGRITTELAGAMQSVGMEPGRPFDLFYPPADAKPSEIGFIVDVGDQSSIARIPGQVGHRIIPRQRFLVATFPFRSPLSFVVGYLRVNPALKAYRKSHRLQQTWAASVNEGKTIRYLQPHAAIAPGAES